MINKSELASHYLKNSWSSSEIKLQYKMHVTVMYDPKIMLLSFGISFLGAYITICLCEQFRICSLTGNQPKVMNKTGLLAMMALSLGGIGVWSMHFVGMSAMKLVVTSTGEEIHTSFRVLSTLISLIIMLAFAWLGLYVGSKDKIFTKTKKEIVQDFVKDSSSMSFEQIRQIKSSQIMFIISTQAPYHLMGGGLLTGLGVCVMHFLGMWALEFDGEIDWDKGIIAASVIIALLASTTAFWILYRLLSLYPSMEALRLGSAVIMAGHEIVYET